MNWLKRRDIDYADIMIGTLALIMITPMVYIVGYGFYVVVSDMGTTLMASAV